MPNRLSSPVPARHPPAVVAAHWLTVAALVIAVAAGLGREVIDNEAVRAALLALHRQAGLLVLLLLALRLAARLGGARSANDTGSAPAFERWLAAGTHLALYLALVVLPLLGWALSDARGQHPHWLGLVSLPTLVPPDPDLADTLEDWHRGSAWALGGIVAMHVSAALWHHWVRRDNVLRAMWPAFLRRFPHRSVSSTSQGAP